MSSTIGASFLACFFVLSCCCSKMKVAMVAAAALALLAVLAMSPPVRSADCNSVTNSLAGNCLQYVVGSSSSTLPNPQSKCCVTLNQLTPDEVCKCLAGRLRNTPVWLKAVYLWSMCKCNPARCSSIFGGQSLLMCCFMINDYTGGQ
ncbi:hypothetical protein O6H91_21G030700 [Diphasiastrum complanatum]|uniref:Uncharacterized protein n=1 Tax=Diphasiastrum complanatum TaxID=34168 RepID=A0ACC2AJ49_DIPCM|nr:hypothetical protein O6H91_21G030700 [Diphasiastrum complanatum]